MQLDNDINTFSTLSVLVFNLKHLQIVLARKLLELSF